VEKIGEILIKRGLVTEKQIQEALAEQKRSKNKTRLGSILIKRGYITEDQLVDSLSKELGIPAVNLSRYEISRQAVKLIPVEIANKYQIIPIDKVGNTITLAMVDPLNIFAIDDVKFMTGCNVEPVVSAEVSIKNAIEKYYDTGVSIKDVMKDVEESVVEIVEEEKAEEEDITKLKAQVKEAPVVKLVNLFITDAVKRGASDIHLEPYENDFRVRYRIDGVLYEVMSPPLQLKSAIISRIKIMAELDIAERRLPQDGRIKVRVGGRMIDLRVSTLPTLFGEKVVMRILDRSSLSLDLATLGFEKDEFEKFMKGITTPYGIILITGPTGSGKTTTLYAALHKINTTETNIMTAEDPVEYNLPGINQVQTKPEIGLTFASSLRAFLRQDPDIVMVGEIRDYETAEIAIKAALTGHLVLSTLHTNDAPSAVSRLLNMGVEPFLISSSLLMTVAQRLVRKICSHCKERVVLSPEVIERLGLSKEEVNATTFFKGRGCDDCSNTGYRGRTAIYEVMSVTDPIRELILQKVPAGEIKEKARALGMRTLRENAIRKLKQGITTAEEVLRVTFSEEEERG
jgi:type IV pilus assembly protein PilB